MIFQCVKLYLKLSFYEDIHMYIIVIILSNCIDEFDEKMAVVYE